MRRVHWAFVLLLFAMTGCLSGQRDDSHAESSTISEIVRVRTGHICGWCTTYGETEVILEGIAEKSQISSKEGTLEKKI